MKGSFDAAVSGLENLRAEGVTVSVNTQVNRVNLLEIPRVFDEIVCRIAKAWQVQLTVAMGRAADETSILLEPYQMLDVMPMLAGLKPRAEARPRSHLAQASNIGYFGPHESLLRDGYPRGHKGSCPAGRTTLGEIEANGDIKGCPVAPDGRTTSAATPATRPFATSGSERRTLRFTRERSAADLSGHCRDCYYAGDLHLGGMLAQHRTSHVPLWRARQ